jgi:hypothetical protein
MSITAVIHQPDYLSYPGFFHRLLHSDIFIILDDVQFVKSPNGLTHRDLIKTPKGSSWLTLNTVKAPQKTAINCIKLSEAVDWRIKHLNLIIQNYKKSPFYDEIYPYITNLYKKDYPNLIDINMESIKMLMKLFDINIPIQLASELASNGSKNELLISLLGNVNATHYLSGTGAKAYLKAEQFEKANIKVNWQQYTPVIYPQMFGDFIPDLSSIDMLFNCGIDLSQELLRKS